MTADRTVPVVLITLFLLFAVPAGLFFRKLPPPLLSPTEVELAKFSSQPVAMPAPQPPAAFSGLACPVAALPAKPVSGGSEKIAKSSQILNVNAKSVKPDSTRSLGSLPVVSVISYDGATRTAIVGNRVVTEGSVVDGGKIVKIEESRVLMRKNGKNIWLTIE